ncbi:MAG: cell division protein ZapA [Aerococcus sp.]|nr:cell division protein ZapA [Aerococcus sp.]
MEKHRYQEKINDRKFVILSDKEQAFVHRSVKQLNQRLSEVSRANPSFSTEDTALLVALNLISEGYETKQLRDRAKLAEKQFREKELQWKREIQALKDENNALTAQLKQQQKLQPIKAETPTETTNVQSSVSDTPAEAPTDTAQPVKAQQSSVTRATKKEPIHLSLDHPVSSSSSRGSLFQGASASTLLANHQTSENAVSDDNPFKYSGHGLSRTKRKRH